MNFIMKGDRHGQPANSTDVVKICCGGGTHSGHRKYQGNIQPSKSFTFGHL